MLTEYIKQNVSHSVIDMKILQWFRNRHKGAEVIARPTLQNCYDPRIENIKKLLPCRKRCHALARKSHPMYDMHRALFSMMPGSSMSLDCTRQNRQSRPNRYGSSHQQARQISKTKPAFNMQTVNDQLTNGEHILSNLVYLCWSAYLHNVCKSTVV